MVAATLTTQLNRTYSASEYPDPVPARSAVAIRVHTVAPKLGQQNAEIFGRMGLSEQAYQNAAAQRVV